ncbi:MAG: amidohydrolase family protein, partial [Acidobacteriota bacterium]|nr:amidohydrolase family protein [Acidobacteriota bacterium]
GDVEAFARMGAYESLLHGVGLVWDHYYHRGSVARALLGTALSGVVAPTLQDIDGPGVATCDAQLDATAELADSDYFAAHGVFAALGPHATDTVSEGLWSRAAARAREVGLPVHPHVAQSIEEVRFSLERRGRPPMTWLVTAGLLDDLPATVFAHCIYVSRDELALLDPARDCRVFCPHRQRVFGFPADPLAWSEGDLRWATATDCSPSNDSMNLQKELRYLAGQRTMSTTWSQPYRRFLDRADTEDAERAWEARGAAFARASADTTAQRLLDRVWHVPGGLHPAFTAGNLAPGTLANLVVWDDDHPSFWPAPGLGTLAMGDTTQAIHAMWVAGREVGRAGDFHRSLVDSDAYRDALAEAEGRRRRIVSGD